MTVNTKPYEKVHGKKPKGSWFWAFHIGPENDPIPAYIPGRFHEAKRVAVEQARELGEENITVLP